MDKAIPLGIASDGRISVSGADKYILTLKSKNTFLIIVELDIVRKENAYLPFFLSQWFLSLQVENLELTKHLELVPQPTK